MVLHSYFNLHYTDDFIECACLNLLFNFKNWFVCLFLISVKEFLRYTMYKLFCWIFVLELALHIREIRSADCSLAV